MEIIGKMLSEFVLLILKIVLFFSFFGVVMLPSSKPSGDPIPVPSHLGSASIPDRFVRNASNPTPNPSRLWKVAAFCGNKGVDALGFFLKRIPLESIVNKGLTYGFKVMDTADAVFKPAIIAAVDVVSLAMNIYDFRFYVDSYTKNLGAGKRIESAEGRIKAALPEATFLDLSRFVRTKLGAKSQGIAAEFNTFLKDKPWFSSANITKELVESLIDVNVANGFANLAETLFKYQNEIPNYRTQNALQNFGYLLETRINFQKIPLSKFDDRLSRIEKITDLQKKSEELAKVFDALSDELLILLFPNKLKDIVFPGSESETVQLPGFQSFVLDFVKSQISNYITEIYLKQIHTNRIEKANLDPNGHPKVELTTLFLQEIANLVLANPVTTKTVAVHLNNAQKGLVTVVDKVSKILRPTTQVGVQNALVANQNEIPPVMYNLSNRMISLLHPTLFSENRILLKTISKDIFAFATTLYDIPTYLASYERDLEAAKKIVQAERLIQAKRGPNFYSLYKFVSSLLIRAGSDTLVTLAQDALKDQPWISRTEIKREFIVSLIELNVANAFANLGENEGDLLNLLIHNLEPHINKLHELKSFKSKAQALYMELESLTIPDKQYAKALFARLMPSEPYASLQSVNLENIVDSSTDRVFNHQEKIRILELIYPNYNRLEPTQKAKIDEMLDVVEKASVLTETYATIFDNLITLLFPNKLDDLVFPGSTANTPRLKKFKSFVHHLIKLNSYRFLHHIYTGFTTNSSISNKWVATLNRVGSHHVVPLLNVPTVGSMQYAKNIVLSEIEVTDLVTWGLNWIEDKFHPPGECAKNQVVISGYTQRPLALWIVQAVQSLVLSEDPVLQKVGGDLKGYIANMTLGLVSNSTDLLIPIDRVIDKDKFLSTLFELAVAKIQSTSNVNQPLTSAFFRSLLRDLPLPLFVQDLIVDKLMEKAAHFNRISSYISKTKIRVETVYSESLHKVQLYPKGTEIVALYEKFADEIIAKSPDKFKQLTEQERRWAESLLVDFAAEFLPGVNVSEDLRKWFKDNMTILGLGFDKTQQGPYYDLIKKGLVALMLKSTVSFAKVNNVSNPDKFIAQLFNRGHAAFKSAFNSVSGDNKQKLVEASHILAHINTLKSESKAIRHDIMKAKSLLFTPNMLSDNENRAIKEILTQTDKRIRAANRVAELNQLLANKFMMLNLAGTGLVWNIDRLQQVQKALIFQKTNRIKSDEASLIAGRGMLGGALMVNDLLPVYDTLLALAKLTPENKKLVEECLKVQDSIELAIKNEHTIGNYLSVCRAQLEQLYTASDNANEFRKAVNTMEQIIGLKPVVSDFDFQIEESERALDKLLIPFHVITHELTALVGIDKLSKDIATLFSLDIDKDGKDKNVIEKYIEDKLRPVISSAKSAASRLVFEQFYPMMLPVLELESTQAKLQQLTGGSLLVNISKIASQEIVSRGPDLLSYKPAKELLVLLPLNGALPTKVEIENLNKHITLTTLQVGRSLIEKEKIASLIQNKVPAIDLDRICRAIVHKLSTNHFVFDDAKPLLSPHFNEVQINEFLQSIDKYTLGLGKSQLTIDNLLQAYQRAFTVHRRKDLSNPDVYDDAMEKIDSNKIIEKIQMNFPIPEQVFEKIQSVFPGVLDLHSLIAVQLNEVVKGEEQSIGEVRETLRIYIEGMIGKLLVRQAEKNGPINILDKICLKVMEFVNSDEHKGMPQKDASEWIIDSIMSDVVGISEEENLDGVPPILSKAIYKTIKEQLMVQATPFIIPLLNREKNRIELDRISRSHFLSNLCTAITKDVVTWIVPTTFKSYSSIAQKLFKEMSTNEPTKFQLENFSSKIAKLVENSKYQPANPHYVPVPIKRKALLAAYVETTGIVLDAEQTKVLMGKLRVMQVKKELDYVAINPEAVIESIAKAIPNLSGVQNDLAKELQRLSRLGSVQTNRNMTAFVQQTLETFLLQFFILASKKNPSQPGKDAVILIIEKLLEMGKGKLGDIRQTIKRTEERYNVEIINALEGLPKNQKIKEKAEAIQKDVSKGTQALVQGVMKDVFGIESANSLEGMPEPIRVLIYDLILDLVGAQAKKIVVSSFTHLQTLDGSDKKVQEAAQNLQNILGDSWARVVFRDIGRSIIDTSLFRLNNKVGDQAMGITLIGDSTRTYLEDLAREGVEIAKVLLSYSRTPALDRILGNTLKDAKRAPSADKAIIAEIVGNEILVKANQAITKILEIEDRRKSEFNQKLATNMLNVAADYFKLVNAAKKRSKELRGTDKFNYEDFVNVAGDKLDPALPRSKPSYQTSIHDIQQKLRMGDPWTKDQEAKLKLALERLIADEEDVIRPIKVELVIVEIEKILGHKLTDPQRKRLKKPDAKGLTIKDIIRKDAEAGHQQRIDNMYGPGLKKLLKLFFPNGSSDLTFIAPDLRKQTWKLIKVKPEIVIILLETLFDRDKLTDIVINIMESTLQNLKEEPVADLSEEDPALNELDMACGAMMGALLDFAKLPAALSKLIRDPNTGEIYPARQKAFGKAMRKQFNEEFIRRTFKIAFKNMSKRNEEGKSIFTFDSRDDLVKEQEKERLRPEKDAKISKLSKDLVDASIDFNLKGMWKNYQARMDRWMDTTFGNLETKFGQRVGRNMKIALEAVFRFFFNMTVGAVFSVAHSLTSMPWIKQKIYEYINLEENKNLFMKLIRDSQEDQPGKSNYAAHLEQLTYQMIRSFESILN